MDEIVIYGASDDLIEVESTSFPDEEFSAWGLGNNPQMAGILGISDGTVLRVRYDEDGIWRFTPSVVGSASVDIVPGVDDRLHSDRVTLTGDNLCWVVFGSDIAK